MIEIRLYLLKIKVQCLMIICIAKWWILSSVNSNYFEMNESGIELNFETENSLIISSIYHKIISIFFAHCIIAHTNWKCTLSLLNWQWIETNIENQFPFTKFFWLLHQVNSFSSAALSCSSFLSFMWFIVREKYDFRWIKWLHKSW